MDRLRGPLFSAYWATSESRDWRGGGDYWLTGCPRHGSHMMAWKAAALLSNREPHGQPHFPDCYWEAPPLGRKKGPFTFSGNALQPPTACHLELPAKRMAAYWFHLSVRSSASDLRKWVISVGRFPAAIVCQVLRVSFPSRWDGKDNSHVHPNLIFSGLCASSHSHKNNHVLCFLRFLWLFDQRNIWHCCDVSPGT